MDKNLYLKLALIVVLVIVAAWELYPPEQTLKPGLDLAGGTSIIYQIDTTGLQSEEIDDLAQRTIRVLRKRVDPSNVMNLIWRPHGNTRIEIQTPLASAETREKRRAYDDARQELAQENINLATVIRSLSKPPQQRTEDIEKFARGSERRREILDNLVTAYDTRKKLQQQRDELSEQLDQQDDPLERAGLLSRVKPELSDWARMDPNELTDAVTEFLEDPNNVRPVLDYARTWADWARVVGRLTDPDEGAIAAYQSALDKLAELNLNVESFETVLEMPSGSSRRREMIEQYKQNFADRAGKIENLIQAFAAYRPHRGRIDDPDDLRRMIKGTGVLEFRILPTAGGDIDPDLTPERINAYIEALKTRGPKAASDDKYVWCEIEDPQNWKVENAIVAEFAEKQFVLASNQSGETMLQQTGRQDWKLQKAYPTTDNVGRSAIGFTLSERGGRRFWELTNKNVGRPLCILLDGRAISAPTVDEPIGQRGIIRGQFTRLEIEDMVNKLNAGALPARLIEPPLSIRTIGPSIGAENRDRGIKAGFIGLVLVAIFMLVYYVGSGSIADVALFMNLLFVLAIMALSRATFTLPGIAGIILTIGMSVDANVLIFERIREEQQRGSSLRIAIRSGYQRAFRTILDANTTTFVTALILYMVASEEIKGFAITLMLGIVSSMFTALFVTRVIFELLMQKKILKEHLLMLQIIRKPRVNWMKARPAFFVLSAAVIAVGLFVFYNRSDVENNKYDIEFTGGTSVQINLKQPLARDEVESKIQSVGRRMDNLEIAAARVYRVGKTDMQYEITTTETNLSRTRITFTNPAAQTVQSVTQAILAAEKARPGQLPDLNVKPADSDDTFVVSTSQVNVNLVRSILTAAFEKENVNVAAPRVEQVVNDAITQAFAGLLQRQEALAPEVTSVERITNQMVERAPELLEFLNGVKITCSLEKSADIEQIRKRINELKFKPDMQQLEWYRYELLTTDLTEPPAERPLQQFVYVSVEPEAGFRELTGDEWQRFVVNEKQKITNALSMETSLPRVTQIDPSIGQQAKLRAIIAIALSLIFIVGYIWARFGSVRFGMAAITALVHDVCIVLGAVVACTYIAQTAIGRALLIGDFKINLEMIAAFLTIIGYSLNDTIVVFDRIRENRGRMATLNPNLINDSINQTLSRTLLTSFTTFLVILVMYIYGGEGLRGFTFAMLLGIIVGTYSSIAIASPILLVGQGSNKSRKP